MTIERIKELLAVPEATSGDKDGDWGAVSTGSVDSLPDAYREFVSTYGTGSIGEFLWVLNPFCSNSSLNFSQSQYFRNAYQSLKADFPQYYPRTDTEFLPWAFTDNGDAIVWLTDNGDPNDWHVCVQASDPAREEDTGLNTQKFLEALLEKKLPSSILPSQFLEGEKQFAPQ